MLGSFSLPRVRSARVSGATCAATGIIMYSLQRYRLLGGNVSCSSGGRWDSSRASEPQVVAQARHCIYRVSYGIYPGQTGGLITSCVSGSDAG